jgi:hypothetical protein
LNGRNPFIYETTEDILDFKIVNNIFISIIDDEVRIQELSLDKIINLAIIDQTYVSSWITKM